MGLSIIFITVLLCLLQTNRQQPSTVTCVVETLAKNAIHNQALLTKLFSIGF